MQDESFLIGVMRKVRFIEFYERGEKSCASFFSFREVFVWEEKRDFFWFWYRVV